MKILAFLFLSCLPLCAAPVSRAPSTNRVYAVTCDLCDTKIRGKPFECGLNGSWNFEDGSRALEYRLRFQCPCGGTPVAYKKFYTHQPQAAEVPDAINPLLAKPTRKIRSPKDLTQTK